MFNVHTDGVSGPMLGTLTPDDPGVSREEAERIVTALATQHHPNAVAIGTGDDAGKYLRYVGGAAARVVEYDH